MLIRIAFTSCVYHASPSAEEPTGLINQQYSGARIHGEKTLHRTQA